VPLVPVSVVVVVDSGGHHELRLRILSSKPTHVLLERIAPDMEVDGVAKDEVVAYGQVEMAANCRQVGLVPHAPVVIE